MNEDEGGRGNRGSGSAVDQHSRRQDLGTGPVAGRRTLVEQVRQAKLDGEHVQHGAGQPGAQTTAGGDRENSASSEIAPRASIFDLFGTSARAGSNRRSETERAPRPGGAPVTEGNAIDGTAVQRRSTDRGDDATPDGANVAEIAGRGVSGPGAPLPHLDRIQASFGHHDVTGVQAHQGAAASTAAHQLGATAYAFGDAVAFGSPPDLHTAAHEAVHVVQQRGGVQLKGGIDQPGDHYERHADAVADAVVAGKPADHLLDQVAGGGGSAARRASVQREPYESMDRARYRAIELQLKNLVSQKKGLVDGSGKGDMAAIDAEIDKLVTELRVDFGVQLDRGKILDDAVAGKDMLVLDGRIVLSPSSGSHYMGERLGAKLEIDHVPPGETLQIGWRWRTPESGETYRFFASGPAFGEKTVVQEMALDTPFWGLVPPAVEKAQGLEILAEIYIRKTSPPTKTFSSGFITMPERPVGEVRIVGAPDRVVKDSYVELCIGPWTPDFRRYSIDWFVDDAQVATDQLALRHPYDKLGKHVTRADVHRVRRSFGIREKQLVRSATTSFEVLTDEQYGNKFLTELEHSPFRPKPVGVNDLLASGDRSLDELQHRIDLGATEQHVTAELAEPTTAHHLRETNFADRGRKPNTGGKGIKLTVAGKGGPVSIETPEFVRLEPIPPGAPGTTPVSITRVEVEAPRSDAPTRPIVKGDLVKAGADWNVPVPGSPYPRVAVEVAPGGLVPYVNVEMPPPGTRVQVKPKDVASSGLAGGHTREAWNTAEKIYGDFVTKTGETGIRFKLPGSPEVIEAAAIKAEVKVGTKTKQLPDPKTVFEKTTQLNAFENHAKRYMAAKVEALSHLTPRPAEGSIITVDVPVSLTDGTDAIAKVEMPWNLDAHSALEIRTWWLAESNFKKGNQFNP